MLVTSDEICLALKMVTVMILLLMVVVMLGPQEVRDERGGVPFEVEQPPD